MISILFILIGLARSRAQERPPFTLRPIRVVNSITLHCRNSDGDDDPMAEFFMNGTRMTATDTSSDDPNAFSFLITKNREGYYSCGTAYSRSNPVALIGGYDVMQKVLTI